MNATCLTPTPNRTPADVLDALRDLQRIDRPPGWERISLPDLTPAAPVIDAMLHLDFESWRDFATTLEWLFDIRLGAKAWRQLLTPVSQRTLGDVAAFIAARAPRLTLRPACLAGTECLTAGAFLALRSELIRAGTPREWITPSAQVERMARRDVAPIVRLFARVAPDALPRPRCYSPLGRFVLRSIGFGGFLWIEGWLLGFPLTWAWAVIGFVGAFVVTSAAIARWFPTRVQIGELQSFRDLARRLAVGVTVRAERQST